MTPIEKSNLARTTIFMLSADTELRMHSFDSYSPSCVPQRNECGTICCLVGHAPRALGNYTTSDVEEGWAEYHRRTFGNTLVTQRVVELPEGDKRHITEFDFLFEKWWQDNKRDTAARVLRFLLTGIPKSYTYKSRYLPLYGEDMLAEELQKFVIPDDPHEIIKQLADHLLTMEPQMDHLIDSAKAFVNRRVHHWMVCGRIPGDDDDSMEYVTTLDDESPTAAFVERMYEGNDTLPKDWADRDPRPGETTWGAWIYINQTVEILGPPIE